MAHEVLFSIVLSLGTGLAAADSPLGDAVAAWHLSDSHDAADKDSTLSLTGAVKLGVELQGDEREQSLRRGGDGMVAVLSGGYFDAGQGADGELNLRGQAMTLAIRLRDPSGKWGRSIFSKFGGGHNTLSYNLFSTELGEMVIGFELGTTATKGMYQVKLPVTALIDPSAWHDIHGDALEIIAEFDRSACTAKRFGLNLRMSADAKQKTVAYFDVASGEMGTTGAIHNGGHSGPACLAAGEPVRMHILLDRSVMEFFINGRAVTERMFPDAASLGVDVFAEGGEVKLRSIDIWELRSIWDEH